LKQDRNKKPGFLTNPGFLFAGVWQDDRNQVFWFYMPSTYATATLHRRLKNLVSVGDPPSCPGFAKLQYWMTITADKP
jgi:hypothetical protein